LISLKIFGATFGIGGAIAPLATRLCRHRLVRHIVRLDNAGNEGRALTPRTVQFTSVARAATSILTSDWQASQASWFHETLLTPARIFKKTTN